MELTFELFTGPPLRCKGAGSGTAPVLPAGKGKVNRIEYVRDGVERRFPYCDYEMFPDSEWNYGFYSEAFEVMFEPVTDTPFSVENPPIRIKAKMVPVPWEEKGGICAIFPTKRKALSEAKDVLLHPTDARTCV